MHRVGADPAEARGPGRRPSRADPVLRLGRLWTHLPVADGAGARTARSPGCSSSGSTPCWPTLAAAGHRGRRGPRRQHRRRHRLPRGPPRHGALRHRPLRRGLPGRWPASCRRATGGRRACDPVLSLRSRVTLRPRRSTPGSGPPTAGSGRCPSARRWPRCPSATPTACRAASSTRAARCSSAGSAGPWPAW